MSGSWSGNVMKVTGHVLYYHKNYEGFGRDRLLGALHFYALVSERVQSIASAIRASRSGTLELVISSPERAITQKKKVSCCSCLCRS